jgi:Protein of unknown function (DUF3617)
MPRYALLLVLTAIPINVLLAAETQLADSLPTRKPGQWEMRLVTDKPAGGPNMDAQMCIDAATDRDLMEFGLRMSRKNCQRYDIKRVGQSWVLDTECAIGPIQSVTHTTISGDFQSNFTVRIEGTTEGMPGATRNKGPQKTLLIQTGRWMGSTCSGGMIPGDITLAGGVKFNVKQIKGLQKLLPNIIVQ